jgi:hypothetical protein
MGGRWVTFLWCCLVWGVRRALFGVFVCGRGWINRLSEVGSKRCWSDLNLGGEVKSIDDGKGCRDLGLSFGNVVIDKMVAWVDGVQSRGSNP